MGFPGTAGEGFGQVALRVDLECRFSLGCRLEMQSSEERLRQWFRPSPEGEMIVLRRNAELWGLCTQLGQWQSLRAALQRD